MMTEQDTGSKEAAPIPRALPHPVGMMGSPREHRKDRRPVKGPGAPLRIAVDFDGVLFDHIPYMLRGFRDVHGIDLEAEGLRYWDFFQYRAIRDARLTYACVRAVLDEIETDPVLHQNPPRDPHAAGIMGRWKDAGHEVSVVTARLPISREVTELFLEHHGIPHDRLVMGAHIKTGYDVLIDDAPHNVLMAAADGGMAVLMDHPYNQDVPTHWNPVRATDWQAVDRYVRGRMDLDPVYPALQSGAPGRMSLSPLSQQRFARGVA
jgi:5'-nucleotidase